MEILAKSRNFSFLSNEYVGIMKKHIWQCPSGHVWEARPNDIKSGCGCPFCAGVAKRSLHDIKQEIVGRDILFLSSAYKNTYTKYKWGCKRCNHAWNTTASSIVNHKTGCPNCAGKCQSLRTMNELAKSRGFNFLSARYKTMNTKYEWKCRDGHTWKATAHHIKCGTGCPYCNNKYVQEEKCRFILEQLTQKKFIKDRSTLGHRLELDGYCEELKLAFEYHGKQHFKNIPYWHKNGNDLSKQQKRETEKLSSCKGLAIDLTIIRWDCNDLEAFLRSELKKRGLSSTGRIEWDEFRDNPSRLEEVQEAAEKVNTECLSRKYIAAREPMKFKCKKCSRAWTSTANDIKNGYGCIRCSGKMKKTVGDMHKLAKLHNIMFVSGKYQNARELHQWRCLDCDDIFWKRPDDIRQGKCCPKCGIKKRWETRRQKVLIGETK